jgi:hypothetical protein
MITPRRAVVFLALCLLFLAFSLCVAFGWWALVVGVPLAAFAVMLLDAALVHTGRSGR